MHCKLVACGVVAGELSGAADGRSRSSCEEGRSKVPSGCFTSTRQINVIGIIKMNCKLSHVQDVIASESGTHLIVLRPGIVMKAQKLTQV